MLALKQLRISSELLRMKIFPNSYLLIFSYMKGKKLKDAPIFQHLRKQSRSQFGPRGGCGLFHEGQAPVQDPCSCLCPPSAGALTLTNPTLLGPCYNTQAWAQGLTLLFTVLEGFFH